jgi:CelD/BcsL family acetyltransferase involved in cellulose biosynthesis
MGIPRVRRIEELDSPHAIRDLVPEYNDLVQQSDTRVPCLHPEYVALWLEWLGRGATPRVVTAWDGDQLVGYAPFMETADSFGPLSIRALRFVGNNIGYPGDILYADVVARRHDPAVVLTILEHARSRWKIPKWDLGFMAPQSPTLPIAAKVLMLREEEVTTLSSQPFVCVELQRNWEGRLATLPRHAVRNFQRRLRKLEGIGEVRLSVVEQPEEAARKTAYLLQQHERWWAASNRKGWFGDATIHGFLVEAARLLASQERAIVFTLELGGNPISWVTGAADGHRYFEYLGSFNPEYKSCSPGTLLDMFVLRHLISRGISRIELGPGVGEHKRVLGGEATTYVQVRGYRSWLRYAARVEMWWKGRQPSSQEPRRAAAA